MLERADVSAEHSLYGRICGGKRNAKLSFHKPFHKFALLVSLTGTSAVFTSHGGSHRFESCSAHHIFQGLGESARKADSTNRSTQFIESSPKPCPIPSGTPLARPVFHRHRPQRPCHMSSEWGMHDNGAQDRAAESARELKKSRPLTERIHTSKCCTNCCTNPHPERPKTTRNAPEPPIFHNNIHKAESFRNRQVIGSSPIVGSTKPLRILYFLAA